MTTADTIADMFENDGQFWENAAGQQIENTIEMHREHSAVLALPGGKRIHKFLDVSMVFLCDDFWDVVTLDDDGQFVDSNGEGVA